MSPALTQADTTVSSGLGTASNSTQTSAFPDGLKTCGQVPPIYSLLRPYEEYPKEVTGPTVWKAEDYRDYPERWTHPLSAVEIEELSQAAENFIASAMPLTGISKVHFPLPTLAKFLSEVRETLLDGKGFILLKGMPVREWGLHKSAVAYMGMGTHLGYFVSQNGRGHVLGHVKDLGEDATKTDRVRIYRTNAKQFFHTDGADLVGLLCMAKSLSGGESDIVSTHHVFNTLQRENPDVVRTLTEPNWYFDRKGETSVGQEEWIRSCVFYLENDPNSSNFPRPYAKFDPNNVTSLARFNSGPNAVIPPLSEKQLYAMKVLDETCTRLALHMILEPGDIQLLSNPHVFHARTAYTDYPPGFRDDNGDPVLRRHLMRLWLAVPETEGGWKLPYASSKEKKRGGVQVNNTPPAAPIDAE